MTNREIARENILRVARKLGHLRERAVFWEEQLPRS